MAGMSKAELHGQLCNRIITRSVDRVEIFLGCAVIQ
jgi:hypothetical protein